MSGANQHTGEGAERSTVTVLDQASWRDLQQGDDEHAFGAAWLRLTAASIQGAFTGALLLNDAARGPQVSSVFLEGAGLPAGLAEAIKAAIAGGRGAVQPPGPGSVATSLALPIMLDGKLAAVAALDVTLPPPARDRLRAADAISSAEVRTRLEAAVDLVAGTLDQPGADAATRAAAT